MTLPKFRAETSLDLSDSLKSLGVRVRRMASSDYCRELSRPLFHNHSQAPFSQAQADFSRLCEGTLFISKVRADHVSPISSPSRTALLRLLHTIRLFTRWSSTWTRKGPSQRQPRP